MAVKKKSMKNVRRDQVYDLLAQSDTPLTLRSIGQGVGLKSITYIRGIVQEMTDQGWLIRTDTRLFNGLPVSYYEVRK